MMTGYEALIDPGFRDTFSLRLNERLPYTHKSQYYVEATLTGNRNSNLLGNDADNIFRGNAGDNTIDGQEGTDMVIFQGKKEEYEIQGNVVKDSVPGRDGTDTLISIEVMRFTDD